MNSSRNRNLSLGKKSLSFTRLRRVSSALGSDLGNGPRFWRSSGSFDLDADLLFQPFIVLSVKILAVVFKEPPETFPRAHRFAYVFIECGPAAMLQQSLKRRTNCVLMRHADRLELTESLVIILNCLVVWFEVEFFHQQEREAAR